ncbi:MAG TPA: RNA polymerase sigma factor [Pyrinomonadaceae bacterium]|nr:RNA polymerase sigma factor [Pyrinomonadaceae bacterium]
MNEAMALGQAHLTWARDDERAAAAAEASDFDYRLAQRVAAGDMLAFEEFYERYHRRVYALCLRMTGNTAEAEDLTQEVFIHVYRKIGSFRGDSSLMTWLHRVTVNRTLMHFRKSAVRRERTTEDGATPEPEVRTAALSGHAPAVDRLVLEKAVTQLAPGYRAVFILHDVEGYEHSEIARTLGISTGTSKSQLHKARLRLRQLIGQEAGQVASEVS